MCKGFQSRCRRKKWCRVDSDQKVTGQIKSEKITHSDCYLAQHYIHVSLNTEFKQSNSASNHYKDLPST